MIKTIDEAFDKIYSYVDYSMTHAEKTGTNVFTLENIRNFLNKLGNPQKQFSVIHVAGTKGKGSVCAMLASALQNAGFKTGLYTSPHLIRFNERIMIDGKMIPDSAIVRLTDRFCSLLADNEHISAFELMTAMAFEYFREQNVDVAVIETGLGGRLDATNTVTPVLSVITSVSLDHTNYLGNTAAKIAAEKAGIIKPNIPVICSYQPFPEAAKVIHDTADRLKAPWVYVPDRFCYINERSCDGKENMLIWRTENKRLMERWCHRDLPETGWNPAVVSIPLKGSHQMQNAAAVYAALNKLKGIFPGLDLNKALTGIGKTFWPCRFEQLDSKGTLVVDGAHNADSAQKLAVLIDRYYGRKTVKCIFGSSEDKNIEAMLTALAPHVDEFILTRSTHPRAADPLVLSEAASKTGRKNRTAASLEDAYNIYKTEKADDVCFIAAGSLFVAGGIRELYMNDDPSVQYFETTAD